MTRVRDALSAKGFVWGVGLQHRDRSHRHQDGTRTGAVVTVEPGAWLPA